MMSIHRKIPAQLLLTVALSLLLALQFSPHAYAKADVMQEEVEHLLEFVAGSGCTFIRNGTEHDSADAADHLRLKFKRGAKYVKTADHFIDRLASESSWTGRDYTVSCDGVTQTAKQWLHQALQDYRATAL